MDISFARINGQKFQVETDGSGETRYYIHERPGAWAETPPKGTFYMANGEETTFPHYGSRYVPGGRDRVVPIPDFLLGRDKNEILLDKNLYLSNKKIALGRLAPLLWALVSTSWMPEVDQESVQGDTLTLVTTAPGRWIGKRGHRAREIQEKTGIRIKVRQA